MNIVIPIGGIGERFKNFSDIPKPFIPIFEKEMIRYVLDCLYTNKEDIIFIVYNNEIYSSYLNSILSKYIDKKNINLIKIDKQTDGAAETILLSLEKIKQLSNSSKIVCVDCDTFYTKDILNLCRKTDTNKVFYSFNDEPFPIYSYIELDEKNKITNIAEKVKISNNANTGIYYFTDLFLLEKYLKKMMSLNIRFKNEYYTSCVINLMIQEGIDFFGLKIDKMHIFNLGTPGHVLKYKDNTLLFLFDLDGTLVLTDDIYYKIWEKILSKYGIQITKKMYKENIFGNTDRDVILKLLITADDTSDIGIIDVINYISNKKDELFSDFLDEIKVINGALSFIKKIKENGHKIAIVTNCNRRSVGEILAKIGFSDYIDFLVIGNECEKSKPHADPYLKAIKYFQSTPEKCIIFEDSQTGIKSGIETNPHRLIGIQSTYTDEQFKNFGVHESIKDFTGLKIEDFEKANMLEKYIRKSTNVQNVHIEPKLLCGGYISEIIKLTMDDMYVILKQENSTQSFLSEMANDLKLYEKEYYFYNNIYSHVPVQCPKFYGLVYNDNQKPIGILLENLFEKDCVPNLDLNIEDVKTSISIIDELTKMHAKFWNNCNTYGFQLQKSVDLNWVKFVRDKWDIFRERWDTVLSDVQMSKAQNIIDNFECIEQHFTYSPNLTLCHGDVKSANIFFTRNKKPIFIDWQYIHLGKGTQDLVFFMIESFETSTMKNMKNFFKDHYYTEFTKYVENYSRQDYEKDFEYSSYYFPFFVAMWFGTMNEDELVDKSFPSRFIRRLFDFYLI